MFVEFTTRVFIYESMCLMMCMQICFSPYKLVYVCIQVYKDLSKFTHTHMYVLLNVIVSLFEPG